VCYYVYDSGSRLSAHVTLESRALAHVCYTHTHTHTHTHRLRNSSGSRRKWKLPRKRSEFFSLFFSFFSLFFSAPPKLVIFCLEAAKEKVFTTTLYYYTFLILLGRNDTVLPYFTTILYYYTLLLHETTLYYHSFLLCVRARLSVCFSV
jgi:hypothetical protein